MDLIILFLLFFISALLLSSIFLTGAHRRRLPLPPGPKGWPLLGSFFQLGSKPHQTLRTLSRSHGSDGLLHLRLGIADVIVISSASTAAKCFHSHDVNLSSRPPNSILKLLSYDFQDLILAPYGPQWRMLRKLCFMHLFSTKALDSFQHVRDEEAVRLVRELALKRGMVVDIGGVVNTCVLNILARVMIGRQVIVGEEEAGMFKEMITEMTRLAGQFYIGDFLPGIDWLDFQGLKKRMIKVRERFGEFLEKTIVEHNLKSGDQLKGNNHFKDFLSSLIEMNGKVDQREQKILTNINIKALLQDMFIAGTETTSITVEWVLAELIRHPHILARAQHELDSIAGHDRLISESDISKSSFLESIVKETLRLHPPVPLSVPRMATEDCEIDGYLIPKGVTLFINVWAIGRDPVSFPEDPYEFKPDRFGPGSLHENLDVKGNDFELIPFGVGRRICVGMNLGLRMVHLLTAMLVHSFDWTLPDDQMVDMLDMEETFGATMHKTRPLMAKAMPRLTPQAYI